MNEKPRPQRDYSQLIEQKLQRFSVWRSAKRQWRSACPVHKGDNVTSLAVWVNGDWRCFKCGAFGDMARLIAAVDGIDLGSAKKYVDSSPLAFRTVGELTALEKYSPRRDNRGVDPVRVLPEASIAAYRKHCPVYLIDRGFSQESLARYEIGYDVQGSKIVLPVRDHEKRIVGITYRVDFDGDRTQAAKYWHDNFPKSEFLYGFHLWARKVVNRLYLVEGQLDAVRMGQLGFAACAILGSDLSKRQIETLNTHARCGEVVLAFDNDEAGEKATRNAWRALTSTRFGRRLGVMTYPGKDPGGLLSKQGISVVPWYNSGLLKAKQEERAWR